MQKNPAISIVIPVRNEGTRIADTIRSFVTGRSSAFPLEFVIVDDASSDGCCDNLALLADITGQNVVIQKTRLETWSGIPYARNLGAQLANAPVLLITDANVTAGPGWDVPLFESIAPDLALCVTIADKASAWKGYGCVLDVPTMGIKWLSAPGIFDNYVPVSPCTGTVIYKDLFMRLGGFDTAMPVYGAAEPEFSVRLWLYGASIKNIPDLVFYHRFRPAAERRPFLDMINLVEIKNYLRFGLLYLNDGGISDMLDYWDGVNPANFNTAFNELDWREIKTRRAYLNESLKNPFDWFVDQFKLNMVSN